MVRFTVFFCIAFVAFFTYAHAMERVPAAPQPLKLVIPKEKPLYNPKEKLYGSTQNSYELESPKTNMPNSVTVTAVVLPARIVTVTENSISISSNHHDPDGYYRFQGPDGSLITLSDDLWTHTRACLYSATALVGSKVCERHF